MAARRPESPSGSPAKRHRAGLARRCERSCWAFVTRLPLVLVYGFTTWAAYVAADLCVRWIAVSWRGAASLVLVVGLYLLLNWSYTVSVLTDPGSPSTFPSAASSRAGYSHLPLHESEGRQSESAAFTVKASGGVRFCKKCQAKKPDRAHHCSTCNTCRLKMDHHCPWLATCVGFRNYKPFILFCAYTSAFCWVCLAISAAFLWSELGTEAFVSGGGFTGVNVVLLAVLSGLIGVVLTGFTAWHFSLAVRNQTTIECLEKTRYLSPLRRNMQRLGRPSAQDGEESVNLLQHYGQQLTEIHANALPGVTRPEEGEERASPALDSARPPATLPLSATESLRQNYAHLERQRERDRYEDYLDEKASEKLPHAFDLGWRCNLRAVFGPTPWLWALPVANSLGDGWTWEPSARWLAARDRVRQQREQEWREQERRERVAGWGPARTATEAPSSDALGEEGGERHFLTTSEGFSAGPAVGRRSSRKSNQFLGRSSEEYADHDSNERFVRPGSGMSLQTLKPSGTGSDDPETASINGIYADDEERPSD